MKKRKIILSLLIIIVLISSVSALSFDLFSIIGKVTQSTNPLVVSHSPLNPSQQDIITITATSSIDANEIYIYVNNQLKKTCKLEPTFTKTNALAVLTPYAISDSDTSLRYCSYKFYPSSELSDTNQYTYFAIAKTSSSILRSETKSFIIQETGFIAPSPSSSPSPSPSPSPKEKCYKNLDTKTCVDETGIYEDVCTEQGFYEFSCLNDLCVAKNLGECDVEKNISITDCELAGGHCFDNECSMGYKQIRSSCENSSRVCCIISENIKDMSKYSNEEVFLISDYNWKDVLRLVPITTWTTGTKSSPSPQIRAYPTLIYHQERDIHYENLAYGKPIEASGYYENNPPENANDGFASTFWNSGGNNIRHWWQVDLREIKNINKIDLLIDPLEEVYDITIKGSIDGQNYFIIETAIIDEFKWYAINFDNLNVRYIRIDFPEGNYRLIFEIKVYNIQEPQSIAFDADSSIHFLQMYQPDKLTIIGNTPQEIDNLFVAQPPLGAGLEEEQIKRISSQDYLSYWKAYKDIVYVEDNYNFALLASTYASLINAPLIIDNGQQSNQNFDIDSEFINPNIFKNKHVVIIGKANCPENATSCEYFRTIEQLQKKYIELTNTDKVILTNPNDKDFYLEGAFQPEKSSLEIQQTFGKHSLATPILASAKHELIILDDIPISFDNADPEWGPDDEAIAQNIELTENLIDEKITELFLNKNKKPEHLTIIASPIAIPDSIFRGALGGGELLREEVDYLSYSQEPNYYLEGGEAVKCITDSENNFHFIFKVDSSLYYLKTNSLLNKIISSKKLISLDHLFFLQPGEYDISIDSEDNVYLIYSIKTKLPNHSYSTLNYIKLNKNGNILIKKENLTIESSEYSINFIPLINLDSMGNIHLVWVWQAKGDVYYQKFDNLGESLTDKINISDFKAFDTTAEIDSNGNIYILFQSEESPPKIRYTKLNNNGERLIKDKEVVSSQYGDFLPSAGIDKNNNQIYLVWLRLDNNLHLYFMNLDNNGTNLTGPIQITYIQSVNPEIKVDSGGFAGITYIAYSQGHVFLRIDKEGNILKEISIGKQVMGEMNLIVDKNDLMHFCWLEDEYNIHNISYSNENGLFNLISTPKYQIKPGRIYSITTSDVSSYIARSIFYDKLISKIYTSNEYAGFSMARECFGDGCAIGAKFVRDKTKDSGYISYCSVHETDPPQVQCDLIGNNPVPEEYFIDKQFITYCDHGAPNGWVNFWTPDIPWLALPVVPTMACSTNDFWNGQQSVFGANMLRKGSVAYFGAVSPASHTMAVELIQFVTKKEERKSLGELNEYFNTQDEGAKQAYIMLGDPTLVPKFKYVCWDPYCKEEAIE